MDRSAVAAIVERHLPALMDRLGLAHWSIRVCFDLREGDEDSCLRGRCTILPDYDRARIELDPDALDDEAAVLDTLTHELLHVVLGPIEVYVAAVRPLADRDETTAAVLDEVRKHAIEQAVICLERMYRGLTGSVPPPPADDAPAAIC